MFHSLVYRQVFCRNADAVKKLVAIIDMKRVFFCLFFFLSFPTSPDNLGILVALRGFFFLHDRVHPQMCLLHFSWQAGAGSKATQAGRPAPAQKASPASWQRQTGEPATQAARQASYSVSKFEVGLMSSFLPGSDPALFRTISGVIWFLLFCLLPQT